ncbi:hypothetical protein B0F90DRAFT_1243241 [Multifurca ochricompacta]|uniref:Uncharacterized protein n=1 Tax=Multifurca ochricompacta TaxID=376703 RepID=A0AAD4M8E4_9AGAM|nr:hypothetical protein B0F90DRAFT_1243241 [Multifurca ochricompacta]
MKKNVPKFVMYEGTFACTLMANEPRADVEIRTSLRSETAAILESATTAIRIRFSRKLRTMQIYSNGPSLCNKTMFCTRRGVPADARDWALLSNNEKECLAALLDFLRIVEAVEGLPQATPGPLFTGSAEWTSKHPAKRESGRSAELIAEPPQKSKTSSYKASFPTPASPTAPLPSIVSPPPSRSIHVTVNPRPRFPSAPPRAPSDTLRKASSTAVSDALVPGGSPYSPTDRVEGVISRRDLPESRLQTRFMPDVGWCVRSGGARYRIMFLDGVALEIDIDEEWVEMVGCDGSVARYTVRDCSSSRKVGDRMKAFREFLPMFDDSRC